MTSKKTIALAFASLAMIAASSAAAEEVRFYYNSHELSTTVGADKVYQRLHARAKKACVRFGARPLHVKLKENACVDGLIGDFVATIDDTDLSRLHAAAQLNTRHAANY